jgi:catalytic LigB subunit of aromatic ring-opening dioxygenase
MAKLVAAFGSSHSIMLTAEREDWLGAFRDSDRRMELYDKSGARRSYDEMLAAAPKESETRVTNETLAAAHAKTFAAIAELKRQIDLTEMDALVIVGDDQKELFTDAMMPSLAIYYGETIRNARQDVFDTSTWYRRAQRRRLEPEREAHYPVDATLSRHLIQGLMARDFDVCAMAGLTGSQFEGHAYSYIHRTYLNGRALPVVPILLNTYYPPTQITPKRCVALGRTLRGLIGSHADDAKIGIIASGGLSHFVVDEEIDRGVLAALRGKDLAYLEKLDVQRLQAGSSEIRSWIVTAAAATDLDLTWVEYIPAYRTPALTGTGLGFARWS